MNSYPQHIIDTICTACRNVSPIRSGKGSLFLMCMAPDMPKYPAQPVWKCDEFEDAKEPPDIGDGR